MSNESVQVLTYNKNIDTKGNMCSLENNKPCFGCTPSDINNAAHNDPRGYVCYVWNCQHPEVPICKAPNIPHIIIIYNILVCLSLYSFSK